MACIPLCSSAVRVPDSQAYRKMDVTKEHISCILELREMLLSFKLVSTLSVMLSSVLSRRVSHAWNPCHKFVTVLSFCPFTLISVLMPLIGLLGTDLHAVGCEGFVATPN